MQRMIIFVKGTASDFRDFKRSLQFQKVRFCHKTKAGLQNSDLHVLILSYLYDAVISS